MENRIISYSQNREDVILAAFFPDIKRGFYVDIGAHHPTEHSVTKYFYNRGWRGINVEPNKKIFKLLVSERPDDINVNVGIADKKAELSYREYKNGDGLSTFSTEMQKYYEKEHTFIAEEFEDHTVPVITLKELFRTNKLSTIHFLKVDIEGFEYEALVGNDWEKYRPEIICIEANHITRDWHPLLKKAGYEMVFHDGLNEYHSCSKVRTQAFSYVEYALADNVLLYKDHERFRKYKNDLRTLKQEIMQFKATEHELRREIVHRDNLLLETKRFRNAAKNLIQAIDKIVMIQLSRFNHPKRKHASRNIEIDKDLDKLSTQELLQTARKIDLQNYYSLDKGSGSFKGQYMYVTLLFCYKIAKRGIKIPLKAIFRTLRKLKTLGGGRG